MIATRAIVLLIAFSLTPLASARPKPEDFYPAENPDPFVGDYQGAWLEGEEVDIVLSAQVARVGRDEYEIRLQSKLDMRATPKAIVRAKARGGTLEFDGDRHHGVIKNGVITGGRGTGKARFELKRVLRESPSLRAKPPAGAIVLFDGSDISQWQDPDGWEIVDNDILMVTPAGEDLLTKQSFTSCTLHIEFRTSWMPKSSGQGRSNSGVTFQAAYEVQILDSYGREAYYDDCGAIYKLAAPRVNASRPPLEWQTYDIDYTAPQTDANGNVTTYGRMTVHHNGVLIHNDQELTTVTGWKDEDRALPHPTEAAPLGLQCHDNYLQFRNIWIVDTSE